MFSKFDHVLSNLLTFSVPLPKSPQVHEGWEVVMSYSVRKSRFHPHGVRKGSGTHATTCSMDPPPIPSVLMRGEWSLGKVLEVYWKWSMIGDTYLGRCLAGLDPDKPGFGVLPPHFREGIENEFIKEGLDLCFGDILARFGGSGIEGALLLFMASIVYHYDTFIAPNIARHTGHCFLNIPLLSNPELLQELKKLVTLEPCGAVRQATGVPRHVKMMEEIKMFYKEIQGYKEEVRDLKERLPQIIKDAIEEKVLESGHVTAQFVLDCVKEAFTTAGEEIGERIEKSVWRQTKHLAAVTGTETDGAETAPEGPQVPSPRMVTLYPTYGYSDPEANKRNRTRRTWDVPQDFTFPPADLFVAWTAWLKGYPLNMSERPDGTLYLAPVRPLHMLDRDHVYVPFKLKKKFDNSWKPVLKIMESDVEEAVKKTRVEDRNYAFVKQTFDRGFSCLCAEYPEISEKLGSGAKVASCSTWVRGVNCKRRKLARSG